MGNDKADQRLQRSEINSACALALDQAPVAEITEEVEAIIEGSDVRFDLAST